MGKTTVVIDDRLIEEAVRAIGVKTKKEAIEAGLKELVMKKRREALRKHLGAYDFGLTQRGLGKLRAGR